MYPQIYTFKLVIIQFCNSSQWNFVSVQSQYLHILSRLIFQISSWNITALNAEVYRREVRFIVLSCLVKSVNILVLETSFL